MASLLDVFISTSAGFLAGIVGSSVNERLKSGVVAVEAELVRLDDLHDKISEVLSLPTAVDRVLPLREVSSIRRRLGINFRSLMPDSRAYCRVSGLLSQLDRVIGRAEDGHGLSAAVQTELDTIVASIRHNTKHASVSARAWWLLRGQ